MSLLYQMKDAIATCKLTEPFTASQVSQVLRYPDWSLERVHNFLTRHCQRNLATVDHYLERVGPGQYRLLRETVRDHYRPPGPFPKY